MIAGRYRVERQLGRGGMGSVFLVQHVHTDERLALKLLHTTVVKDAATLDRFRREARTPARIDSDHVVRVTDADVAPELDNVPFLVMEYLRGEDLEQLAERRGAMPASEVVLFLSQGARALDKAHGIGIVHRDLKPENMFLTQREDGTPCIKILDFGIAKMTGGDVKENGRLTSTGQIFGTPLYMSPEQALAEGDKICPQTDVWALGLIAHRMLTGNEFWTAKTLTHLVAQIAFEAIPLPSARGCTLGAAYDGWFARCCSRDIEVRFKTAGEAIAALAVALRVTDSPSQLARLPVSVRIPTANRVTDERDMLAATKASDSLAPETPSGALTSPSATPATALGRTQFAAEVAKPGRVPRTLGYVLGGALAVLAGGIAAWKYTGGPPANGGGPVTTITASPSSEARPLPSGTAAAAATNAPIVTPSDEVPAASASVASSALGPKAASPATLPASVSAGKTAAPSGTAKPSSAPTVAPSAAPTVAATVAPAKTSDPYGTRR